MDALLLSRIQFGFVISYHILFPAFTLELAAYVAVLGALWMFTTRKAFTLLYTF